LEKLARDKQSSLLLNTRKLRAKKFYNMGSWSAFLDGPPA
jgi:hypothetical protein